MIEATGYVFHGAREPFRRETFTIDGPGAGEVVVAVAGCGLCHTDIGFYTGAVKTAKSPLILGHEISGTVVVAGAGAESLEGKRVVVPAVLPCGECELCRRGRGNVCQKQVMPGNHIDGGFASHIRVPAGPLCVLPDDLAGYELAELAVVADAVTTPYQSFRRSGLAAGDLAVVIGVGGLGGYMVQLVRSVGAEVIAVDIDERKLDAAGRLGACHTINARGLDERDLKKAVRSAVKERGLPAVGWKVFEMSGTAAGQQAAFALLSFAGTVGIVGFTMDRVSIRLSNVMAFDADVFGNWGCRPELYPEVVDLVLREQVNVRDHIERHPLDSINELFAQALEHKLEKRAVLMP